VARAVWVGERLHLLCHHDEAASGLPGAGRLDRRVERQEVRLRGDPRNQVDDVADAARGGRKPRHSGARFCVSATGRH
jgi:hypothetical protein